MVDLAADELGIDPAELRRRNMHPARARCRSRPALTFTYDCGEFEKNMDLALDARRLRRASQRAAREAQKRGKLRGIGLSNTIERAGGGRLRRRRDPLRPRRHGDALLRLHHPGPGPRDRVQADRVRPARPRSQRGPLHPGRHRQGVVRRRHRRLALGDACRARPFTMAAEKIVTKAKAIAAHMLKVDVADIKFDDGVFSSRRPTGR